MSDHPRASGYIQAVNGALVDVLALGATVPGLPFPPWYKPQVGDSVIVSWLGSQPYVETMLAAAPPPAPPPPVFSTTQNTPQTGVALNTWTAVLFDVGLVDTHGGHDNTANPSRYTIPAGRGGIWQFQGVVAIGVGTGYGGVCLAVNGVRVKGSAVAKASGAPTVATPAKLVTVAAGDYVEVLWYLDSATGTYVQPEFASSFDGRFIQ